jgi:hypothetical protein
MFWKKCLNDLLNGLLWLPQPLLATMPISATTATTATTSSWSKTQPL